MAIVTLFNQPNEPLPEGFFPDNPVKALPGFPQVVKEKLLNQPLWGAGNNN